MSYYCANYYSSINCQNIVNRFGDRCDLCLMLKSGASLSQGMLPEESFHSAHAGEVSRKHRHRGRDRSHRSVRVDSQYQK